MDTLAHGLWGGVGFSRQGGRKFAAAFVLGMAPDLLSFGLFHVTRPGWLKLRLAGEISGPPAVSTLPEFIFHAYNLTHSLVLWGILFVLIWMVFRRPAWPFLAWGLHILCDIPTHNSSYFPTPYLWPLPTPYVEGIPWATPWFIITNYVGLLAAYFGVLLFGRMRRNKKIV